MSVQTVAQPVARPSSTPIPRRQGSLRRHFLETFVASSICSALVLGGICLWARGHAGAGDENANGCLLLDSGISTSDMMILPYSDRLAILDQTWKRRLRASPEGQLRWVDATDDQSSELQIIAPIFRLPGQAFREDYVLLGVISRDDQSDRVWREAMQHRIVRQGRWPALEAVHADGSVMQINLFDASSKIEGVASSN